MKRLIATFIVFMVLVSCATQQRRPSPDYSLHDIWVLIEIDGEVLDREGFGRKGAPQFEFYAEEGRLSGHAGCNNFSTSFTLVEQGVMDVGMALTTRMMCEKMEAENLLTQEFLGHRLNYQIANLRLTLTNETGRTVKFMKID